MEVERLDIECQSTRRRIGHMEKLYLVMNKDLNTVVYVNVNAIESKREVTLEEVQNAFKE